MISSQIHNKSEFQLIMTSNVIKMSSHANKFSIERRRSGVGNIGPVKTSHSSGCEDLVKRTGGWGGGG